MRGLKQIVAFLIVMFCVKTITAQKAELELKRDHLIPLMRLEPSPRSGKVNLNAPWFYWSPVVKSKTGVNTYTWDESYLYQGRLSMDKDFKGPSTIVSDEREWAFFNPHRKLQKGTWYWQYAIIDKKKRGKKWSKPIKFEITGSEQEFVVPSFEKVMQNIPQSHPRILCEKGKIGNLSFPEQDVEVFLNRVNKDIEEELPKSLLYNDEAVIAEKKASLSESNLKLFVAKRTKEIYRSEKQNFEQFIKAYLITDDQKYLNESLRRYHYLKNQYLQIVDAGAYNDFTEGFYLTASTLIYDVCYDFLTEEERGSIQTQITDFLKDSYPHILHKSEHFSLDNHLWQHHLRSFFVSALALAHHVPEAEKWLKYVYEVWTMRAPVGSMNDGSWEPGNGYFDANKESLITMPVILSRLSGVNYFKQAWYENSPVYQAYTSPVGHISGSFGDNADIKRENNMDFVRAITTINGNPFGKMYSNLGQKLGHPQKVRGIREPIDEESKLPMSLYEDGNLYWYMYQPKGADIASIQGISKPERARCFRDVGVVAMHTDLLQPDKNLMVAFRSSPYGLTGHAHACQNSFNIQYGGSPLFFRTGYYSSFIDPHSTLSYRHSRAHNTVLADGLGQTFTSSGYGWIARFVFGEKISYALGDASEAYSGLLFRDLYPKRFKKWELEAGKENGFGDPGVNRFRRHITMAGDNLIVIYDELEAEKPVEWSWLIHSRDTLSLEDNVFYSENEKGKGKCWLFNGNKLKNSSTDQFFSPAIDWLGNGAKRGIVYKNHWHGEGLTPKVSQSRFLAIIQIKPKNKKFDQPKGVNEGQIEIDGWHIEAELNANKEAYLRIEKSGVGAIHFGSEPLIYKGKIFKHNIPGSTLFLEENGKRVQRQEAIDQLPDAAIYY